MSWRTQQKDSGIGDVPNRFVSFGSVLENRGFRLRKFSIEVHSYAEMVLAKPTQCGDDATQFRQEKLRFLKL
jgi:hypothetical protein